MDEEEIDAWYEERKDKLTERYRQKIDKSKDKEKLKKDYRSKMEALHRQYEKISANTSDSNLRWFFFNYRLNVLKEKMMRPFVKLKEKFEDKRKKPEA